MSTYLYRELKRNELPTNPLNWASKDFIISYLKSVQERSFGSTFDPYKILDTFLGTMVEDDDAGFGKKSRVKKGKSNVKKRKSKTGKSRVKKRQIKKR